MTRFVLLAKAVGQFKHSGKYYLHNGRWHKIHKDKPAPKKAPTAAHLSGVGKYEAAKHFSDDEWAQLKLPAENTNAASHNAKVDQLKQLSESGNVAGILALPFGVNTYGKKAAIIANKLLGLHGSPHTVEPGQKAGQHPALHEQAPRGGTEALAAPAEEAPQDKPKIGPIGEALKEAAANPESPAEGVPAEPAAKPHSKHKLPDLDPVISLKPQGLTATNGGAVGEQILAAYESGDLKSLKNIKSALFTPTFTGQSLYDGKAKKAMAAFLEAAIEHLDDGGSAAPPPALSMPDFAEGKTTSGVVSYYEKVAQKVIDHGLAGNAAVLEDMLADGLKPNAKTGKVGNTWKGKTANSKALLELHAQALAHAKGESPAPAAAPEKPAAPVDPKPAPAKPDGTDINVGTIPLADAKTGALAPTLTKKVFTSDNPVWYSQSNADQIMLSGKVKFAGQEPNEYAKQKLAEYKAAKDAGYSFTHYKVSGLQYAYVFQKDGQILTKQGMADLLAGPGDAKPVPPKPEPEPAAPAAAATAAPAASKLDQIPWEGMKTASKSNQSHNNVVDKIKELAYAGDVAGLQALADSKAGAKQTYTVKQHKLAVLALAALNENGAPAAPSINDLVYDAGSATAATEAAIKYVQDNNFAPEAYDAAIAAAKANGYDKLAENLGNAKAAAQHDSGPKEGDTKVENGVTYVLKGGRWHKASPDELPAADKAKILDWLKAPDSEDHLHVEGKQIFDQLPHEQKTVLMKEAVALQSQKPQAAEEKTGLDALKVPDFSGKGLLPNHQAIFEKVAAKLLAAAQADGKDGLKGKVVQHKAGLKAGFYSLKVDGAHIKNINPNSAKEAWQDMHAFVSDLLAAAKAKPKAKPAQPAAPAPAPPAADVESMDKWEQTGPQGGSNPGGRFKDADGVEWYCKFPADADMAKAEILAAKFYGLAGLSGQDAKLVRKDGKIGIASKWTDVKKGTPQQLADLEGAQSGFAVDAWLANWDVVGLAFDNLQIGADGKAHRVDAGGSLMYRAQGGKKAFGEKVAEIDSLRDAGINPQAAAVFGSMSEADITASVAKVAAISDNDIYSLVMEHGPGSIQERAELVDTLIARKEDLLTKYPKAAKKTKAKKEKGKPDPTKLKVDASELPPVHDFKNWKGPGSGLSSVDWINESNQKAEQDLLEFALKGNLVALKDYHFEAVNKESGASLGMKPIEQHPSQHVKGYWSDLVATLNYIANPPEAMRRFKSVVAASVKKVSDAFKAASYGVTTNHVAANSRLAFWIALGHTKPAETLAPPGGSLEFESEPAGVPALTPAMRSAAKKAYAELSSSRPVKRFINGIQASGSYNDNFRDGKMITNDGYDAVGMTLDAYDYATEKPEGFELYKWVSFPGNMGQQLLQAPPGTVFQNPGSMCCSYMPTATSGFGPDRIRIRYAKGAKGVDSFGSGSFKSEHEITTLPGQRFVILSCKKVQCPVKGKQRIELDVLMLPPDQGYVAELEASKGQHGNAA